MEPFKESGFVPTVSLYKEGNLVIGMLFKLITKVTGGGRMRDSIIEI
jgi:hypothetical protein